MYTLSVVNNVLDAAGAVVGPGDRVSRTINLQPRLNDFCAKLEFRVKVCRSYTHVFVHKSHRPDGSFLTLFSAIGGSFFQSSSSISARTRL